MNRSLILLGLLATLSACGDGQPLFDEDPDGQVGDGIDTDGDGIFDVDDDDDDNDGIPDDEELDTDRDGLIDDRDIDDDNDGILDERERDSDDDGLIDDTDPDDDNDGVPDVDETPGGIGGDPDLPPGTTSPTTTGGIFRREAQDDKGGGFVEDVSYNRASDTFTVDNLAFDGANVYSRDTEVASLGTTDNPAVYNVYAAEPVAYDDDGDPIGQFQYRAIYGVSANRTDEGDPVSRFAIVRTGDYADYGFGGFIYERNGGVDLPTSGQAVYDGDYAGIRVFDGQSGLEYTQGDVVVAVDFEDFNEGSGVQGRISNREAFDVNGNPIALGGDGELILPDLTFDVGPGVVSANGEISSTLKSYTVADGGALEVYEEGTYYAIVGGEGASEIVGVFVVESEDPRFSDVTAQETGGFIVYR